MAVAAKSVDRSQENKRGQILDHAARTFAQKGYVGTSVRDIAAEVGVRPSSLYYFFKSKDDLLEAVYERGVHEIMAAVETGLGRSKNPWVRLERAAVAHLETLLSGADYSAVVANVVPRGDTDLDRRLIFHRDRYERLFARLVSDLELPAQADRLILRLSLLSALNGVVNWYRPGRTSPKTIAKKIVGMFRRQLDPSLGDR